MRFSQKTRATLTEDYAPANPSSGRECGGTGSVTPAAPQSRWSPDTGCARGIRSLQGADSSGREWPRANGGRGRHTAAEARQKKPGAQREREQSSWRAGRRGRPARVSELVRLGRCARREGNLRPRSGLGSPAEGQGWPRWDQRTFSLGELKGAPYGIQGQISLGKTFLSGKVLFDPQTRGPGANDAL